MKSLEKKWMICQVMKICRTNLKAITNSLKHSKKKLALYYIIPTASYLGEKKKFNVIPR